MDRDVNTSRGVGALIIGRIENRYVHWMRVGLWGFLAFCLAAPAVQFQLGSAKLSRKAASLATRAAASEAAREESVAAEEGGAPVRFKEAKGAIGRWRGGVREFWEPGRNIYEKSFELRPTRTTLHPNMPFTVIVMTPLAYMPVWAMVLTWNLLKVACVLSAFWMTARLVCHGRGRVADWVVLLGFAWAATMIVGDIQHGNTNCFVLWAVVFHLWLFRKGQGFFAGAPLALAICLKMTPALFVLYWLYQRNARLLVGVAASLALSVVVVPVVTLGVPRSMELTYTWWTNLIRPGLLENSAYPTHINQSLPGAMNRYLVGAPHKEGDIDWNPDDDPDYRETKNSHWIALANLTPSQAKTAIRAVQLAVLLLIAWAIGWRRLPPDDGRRALHYGLVVLGMMLLNQRTWDHHATVMLVPDAAVWCALVAGRPGRAARRWALGLMLAAGGLLLIRGDLFKGLAVALGHGKAVGEEWGNLYSAYGPMCLHFLLVFAAAVILSVSLRRQEPPYEPAESAR